MSYKSGFRIGLGLCLGASLTATLVDGTVVSTREYDSSDARLFTIPYRYELHTMTSTGESVAAFRTDEGGRVFRW